jgi:phosphoenolpyruvate---glycerone phosphotransferase subunit DhaK
VLAEKICGAAAEQAVRSQEVTDLCNKVNGTSEHGRGADLLHRPRMSASPPSPGEDEIEIGIGIHGDLVGSA